MNSLERLVLGTSVFGWSIKEDSAHELIDLFVSRNGRILDTSDFYSEWVPGNGGGESEKIIGNWVQQSRNRENIEIITKVGLLSQRKGLSKDNILAASEDSLRRLKTDYIDVYMPHRTPNLEEVEDFVDAFSSLFLSGKIRSIGFSHCNYDNLQMLVTEFSSRSIPVKYVEDNFNMLEREIFRTTIPWTQGKDLEFIAARGLAGGFLTGKYKGIQKNRYVRIISGHFLHLFSAGPKAIQQGYRSSLTSASVSPYLKHDLSDLFEVLQRISRERGTSVASVVLSWTLSQVGVSKTCVSFRTCRQLKSTRIINLVYEEITKINDALEKV